MKQKLGQKRRGGRGRKRCLSGGKRTEKRRKESSFERKKDSLLEKRSWTKVVEKKKGKAGEGREEAQKEGN